MLSLLEEAQTHSIAWPPKSRRCASFVS